MKNATKLLLIVAGSGFLYALFQLYTGHGSSGIGDFIDAISYTSVAVCGTAFLILIFNVRHLNRQLTTTIFLFIALPITIAVLKNSFDHWHHKGDLELSDSYPRPVTPRVYLEDSSKIAKQIDSIVALKNKRQGLVKVATTFIDTIVYSQTGKRIFVSYIQKIKRDKLENDLIPAYITADKRDSVCWHLKEGTTSSVLLNRSYHDIAILKMDLHKFYFDRYSFSDKDSLKSNFFWRFDNK